MERKKKEEKAGKREERGGEGWGEKERRGIITSKILI